MSVLAVSDIHIHGPNDPSYGALLRLIDEKARSGDTVVLAGDIFDLFVGSKRVFLKRYEDFFTALSRALSRGVHFHYIEGNHDFHLSQALRGYSGVELHPDFFCLEVSGKRFYFAHGDLVDRRDYRYRILRFLLRSWLAKFLIAGVPGGVIEWIGSRWSSLSRSRPMVKSDRLEDLRKIYRNFSAERIAEGNDYVILGHCHDRDEMGFQCGMKRGQYINIGYPPVHGTYVRWDEGENSLRRDAFN